MDKRRTLPLGLCVVVMGLTTAGAAEAKAQTGSERKRPICRYKFLNFKTILKDALGLVGLQR